MGEGKKVNKTVKPWGSYDLISHGEKCTVKLIHVSRAGVLSLQSHKNRSELWIPLDKGMKIEVGKKKFIGKKGYQYLIPKGIKHRLSSLRGGSILELSFGNVDENDIIRYDDIYGRIKKSKK